MIESVVKSALVVVPHTFNSKRVYAVQDRASCKKFYTCYYDKQDALTVKERLEKDWSILAFQANFRDAPLKCVSLTESKEGWGNG